MASSGRGLGRCPIPLGWVNPTACSSALKRLTIVCTKISSVWEEVKSFHNATVNTIENVAKQCLFLVPEKLDSF